jgi:murein DD-endopeptidase MepM/ murein hydrolase activator NlpD
VIQIGYAESSVQASLPAPPKPVVPGPAPKQTTRPKTKKTPIAPEPSKTKEQSSSPLVRPPLGLQPKLSAGGYVFPVYGPSSFGDTFGAFRGDVSGNWHHGDDIFAPLGAPILAVADGTVFSVGWNDVGGNRLWLRDDQGNEFYYAHLSAYTPLAKNGLRVHAGEMLGFVGNTGDAQGTPTHLHFEVHPFPLLFMGYDGAVDPTPYLNAWKHLQDVRFSNVASWLAQTGIADPAPKPAAILLQVSDISEASGLDPASLQRAMTRQSGGADDVMKTLGLKPRAPRP